MYYGILFSGQGAQQSGMGVELMADSLFSRIVSQASAVCELDLLKIMKNEHKELNKTAYVQPAIVTVSYGIYRMLKRDLPQLPIKGMIGLSLGEYAALIASNALSFEEGIKLVADRAHFMQQDADREISTLAAVLDPQLQEIQELITAQQENNQRVYIANYNSPQQIVVGGALTDLKATLKKIEEDNLAKERSCSKLMVHSILPSLTVHVNRCITGYKRSTSMNHRLKLLAILLTACFIVRIFQEFLKNN